MVKIQFLFNTADGTVVAGAATIYTMSVEIALKAFAMTAPDILLRNLLDLRVLTQARDGEFGWETCQGLESLTSSFIRAYRPSLSTH